MFNSYCSVVTQHDRCWTWLTCREALQLALGFHQAALSRTEVESATDNVLQRTGLASCAGAHTPRNRNQTRTRARARSPTVELKLRSLEHPTQASGAVRPYSHVPPARADASTLRALWM